MSYGAGVSTAALRGGIDHGMRGRAPDVDTRHPNYSIASEEKSTEESPDFLPVEDLHQQYDDYLHYKGDERVEARQARHYYHGDHWTSEELRVLRARKQPPQMKNEIARNINRTVGFLEKLNQDPKGVPTTPNHDKDGDLATYVVRYGLEENNWPDVAHQIGLDGGIDGFGGIELTLEHSNIPGDLVVGFREADPDLFFYDVRSFRPDFSDARYKGTAQWKDLDAAIELFPDKEEELRNLIDNTGSADGGFSHHPDRDSKWVNSRERKVKIVDHWYIYKGEWRYCMYCHDTKLREGVSPFFTKKHGIWKTMCKYIFWSAFVDHDGDRYGLVRNQKSTQDEINHRASKALQILNSRRVVATRGAVDDVETARREWARPDGWVEVNEGQMENIKPEDSAQDFAGQLTMLQEAKRDMMEFGPSGAMSGVGGPDGKPFSGRALSILYAVGIAELGTLVNNYRTWKREVYKALWHNAQRHWNAERWIRVTDDEDVAQFIQVNGFGYDQFGVPQFINKIGEMAIDIKIDEGPNSLSVQADTFEMLMQMLQAGQEVPADIIIELAPDIDSATRKRILDRLRAPDPMAEKMKALGVEKAAADVEYARGSAEEQKADAAKAKVEAADQVNKADAEKGKVESETFRNTSQGIKHLADANEPQTIN